VIADLRQSGVQRAVNSKKSGGPLILPIWLIFLSQIGKIANIDITPFLIFVSELGHEKDERAK
jgi:hypothetical protein